MWNAIFVTLAVLNLASFIQMYRDKRKAIKEEFRIPEKTLLGHAFFFGSLGVLIAMHSKLRHKTRKFKFRYGVPIMFILQVLVLMWFAGWLAPFFS